MDEAWQSAWVEVLPDFSEFRRTANPQITTILGNAGAAGGTRAGTQMNGGVLAAIPKLAGPLLAAFAALGLGTLIGETIGHGINYALDSVELASDLSETKSAISVLFGDASDDIEAFADTAVGVLGQTEQEALLAAQTFGIFAKAAGLTGDELAGFSTELVGLSADLASFFNTDSQTAIDAIGAGLRGEAEPLRQFGVLLDDTTLKARALELGIYDGSGALSSQQRILAAQAEILAQTSDAQGDVARTSDGLAFQQKKLASALETTQARMGEALLPAFTEFVTLANDEILPVLVEVVDQVGPALGDALIESLPDIKDLVTELAPLIPQLAELGIELLPVFIEGLRIAAPFLIDAAANATFFWTSLNDIIGLLTGDTTVKEYVDDISDLGGSMVDTAGNISDFFVDIITNFRSFVADMVNGVIDGLNAAGNTVEGFVNSLSAVTGITLNIKDLAHLYLAGPVAIEDSRTAGRLNRAAMADGAYVSHRPGGVAADVGEGDFDEVVLPLSPAVLDQVSSMIAERTPASPGKGNTFQLINPDPHVLLQMLEHRLGGRLSSL